MNFANRLVKARESIPTENGKTFTQAQLAEAIDVATGTISNWEQGRCKPRGKNLDKLCDYFHFTPDYLYGRIEAKTHDTEFIHDSTGLSEKSLEKLASILSESNGDNLPDIKADDYKYLKDKQKIARLNLEFINFLLEDDESFSVLMGDLRSCYANYSFWQTGETQRRKEANAIHALSLAENMKRHESDDYQAGISDEQVNDRKASYESKRFLAQEHYSLIIEHIMRIIYEDESF